MDAERTARRWFLAAVPYFLVSVGLGVYMGASGEHALFSVHSHVALLGWASMALIGVLYRAFPAAASSRLASWHFYLYQVALPVMLVAVAMLASGNKGAEPFAGISSVALFVSVLLFGAAVFMARNRS